MEHFTEYSKHNRGGGQRWPASRNRLTTALALAGALTLPGLAQAVPGTCGGAMTPTFIAPTPDEPRFIGDVLRVRQTLINNDLVNPWRASTAVHKLDCGNGGFLSCADEGEVMQFVGNVTTNCQNESNVDVTWATAGGGVGSNEVTFTPSAPVVLDKFGGPQNTCFLDYDIRIASLSTDATPYLIKAAMGVEGECFDATGTLDGTATGSISTGVATCGITLKKQVSDGVGGWLDADDELDASDPSDTDGEDLLRVVFKDADPISALDTGDVSYRLVVKNTSTVTMSSVLVSDSALEIPATEVGPLTAGQEKFLTGTIGAKTLDVAGRCTELGDLDNTSNATGICRATSPVVDEDASNIAWVRCIGVPRIEILKEVSLTGAEDDWYDANANDPLVPDDVPVGQFGADAYYRITVKNTGTEDLENVVVNDSTLGISGYQVVGTGGAGKLAVGEEVVLDEGVITKLLFEERCDKRGDLLNTAEVLGESVRDGTRVSDEDPAVLECVGEPGIDILKEISVDGGITWADAPDDTPTVEAPSGARYRLTVTNTGNIPLVNQEITDGDLGIGPVTIPGVLNPGVSYVLTSSSPGFAALDVAVRCDHAGTFINEAVVTADPIDDLTGLGVTDTDPATLICTGDDLCLTRTPGFWGTHPHVTDLFLDIQVCGKTIDNTAAGNNHSSAEAMCVSGQDASKASPKSNMHYLQLVRQLTAAKLNIAASATNEGTCDTVGGVDIDALIERCERLCGASATAISSSGCIEALDAFNNSEDTLQTFGPFVTPGPADPAACQTANGNGIIVR